jgi:ABC-type phosphate transport system substrate-binding protein
MLCFTLAYGLARGASGEEAGFVVVIHRENRVDSMPRREVSAIFLKKVSRWRSGETTQPVDLEPSPVREKFSRAVHGRGMEAVAAYWQQRVFSGRDSPPPERKRDEDVLAYVRDNPNAIGYVSGKASTADVKVLRITE